MIIRLFGPARLPASARRRLLKAVRMALGPAARRRGELCVIFVSGRRIRRINKRFLGRDRATDVIAFPYRDPTPARPLPGETPPFADIYISLDAARRQARELGHGVRTELTTLAVHGALHLSGCDDKKPAAKRRMFTRQERIVRSVLNGKA